MLEKYRPALESLSPSEGALLWSRLKNLGFVLNVGSNSEPPRLYDACENAGLSQADLVVALAPDQSYVAKNAIEKLVGRPITVLAPPTLLDPARAAIRALVAHNLEGDQRRIRNIVPNPRRPGSAGHERFSKLREGMKVVEFYKAGGRRSDIRKGLRNGWFVLEEAEQ